MQKKAQGRKRKIDFDESKPNMIIYGDSPLCPSGFGTVIRNLSIGLCEKFNLLFFGINGDGFHEPSWPWNVIPAMCWSNGARFDPLGVHRFLMTLEKYEYEHVFMLQDSWNLCGDIGDGTLFINRVKEICEAKGAKLHIYFPVDGDVNASWLAPLCCADTLQTYTHWGWRQCVNALPEIRKKLGVVYHGTSPECFYMLEPDKKAALRKDIGLEPDDFAFLFVGQNQPRKMIPWLLKFFKTMLDRDDGKRYKLLLHTNPVAPGMMTGPGGVISKGWNLHDVADKIGVPQDKIIYTKQGSQTLDRLNEIYNSADMMIQHCAEGWGLPVTEAFSSGLPVLACDHTSLSEIVGDGRGFQFQTVPAPDDTICIDDFIRPNPSISDAIQVATAAIDSPEVMRVAMEAANEWAFERSWENIAKQFTEHILKSDGTPAYITDCGSGDILELLESKAMA